MRATSVTCSPPTEDDDDDEGDDDHSEDDDDFNVAAAGGEAEEDTHERSRALDDVAATFGKRAKKTKSVLPSFGRRRSAQVPHVPVAAPSAAPSGFTDPAPPAAPSAPGSRSLPSSSRREVRARRLPASARRGSRETKHSSDADGADQAEARLAAVSAAAAATHVKALEIMSELDAQAETLDDINVAVAVEEPRRKLLLDQYDDKDVTTVHKKKSVCDFFSTIEAALHNIGIALAVATPGCVGPTLLRVLQPVAGPVVVAAVMALFVLVIIPAFVAILVFKAGHIETEASGMQERVRTVLMDTPGRRCVRWMLLLAMALPLGAVVYVLPTVIVYKVLGSSPTEAQATAAVLTYFGVVMVLQGLGTWRASKSWAARQAKASSEALVPPPPPPAPQPEQASGQGQGQDGAPPASTAPPPPQVTLAFKYSFSNIVAAILLLVDVLQLAFFPLQFDPFRSGGASAASTTGNTASSYTGPSLFRALYLSFL